MEVIELKARESGAPKQTVAEQLMAMGYIIRDRGVPKFFAEKDGVCYCVFITPLFGDRKLKSVQVKTANMLENNEVKVMTVKMPK